MICAEEWPCLATVKKPFLDYRVGGGDYKTSHDNNMNESNPNS